jgi:hypothetical protein
MRWFVEISSLGSKGEKDATLCVEAPQWQPALQKARALRGDNGALSNFSIELLDEGYRAIDPVTRLRYVVRRAPDDAQVTAGTMSERPPNVAPSARPPGDTPPPSEGLKKRAPAPTVSFSSEGAAIIKPEAEAPPAAQVATAEGLKKRAPAPTMAYASSGSAAVTATPAPAEAPKPLVPEKIAATAPAEAPPVAAAVAPAATEALPSFVVIGSREDNPTESSPLTYREYVYSVAQGTPEDEARRLILERFDHVRSTLDPQRAGKLINLAVFDHIFHGRPQRRPLVTLNWKDWKAEEPEIHFPQRDAGSETPLSARSAGPVSAPTAAVVAAPAPPVVAAPAKPEPAPAAKPLAAAPKAEPAPAPPVKAEPASVAKAAVKAEPAPAAAKPDAKPAAKPEAAKPAPAAVKAEPAPAAKPAAKVEPAPAAKPAAKVEPVQAKPAAKPAAPAPASAAKAPAAPKKRLTGDDLLAELFEAFGDLHFARDSLEGAEFVLQLTLEKLPSEVGVVSLFDMNTREFVVVRQSGGPRSALCARQPEKAPLALSAMRRRHAIVVADREGAERAMDDRWRAIGVELKSLVCAPIELSGRYLGLLEVANPVDGKAFNEGDGNALTYIGQQFAEFVASRGVIVDPAHIRGEDPQPEALPSPNSGPRSGPTSAQKPVSSKKGR